MWYTITIVVLFMAILASLAFGLYSLLTETSSSTRLVTSLTVRISLTVLLMALVVAAWLNGGISSQAPWLYR